MPSSNTPLWMCLYFNKLPLEVFIRKWNQETTPDDQAVVITEKQRVFRLNQAAQDLGIKPGNSMDTAYTLSDKVVGIERNEDKEISTLSHLAQWAYQFTPNVSIRAPDCLLLDITGCTNLFKGLDALVDKVNQSIQQLGYQPIIATNVTPLSAMLTAQALRKGRTIHEMNSNDVMITEAFVRKTISHIPVRYLHTDEKIINSLHQMGVHSVNYLLTLPTSGLLRRFGIYFVDYLERLLGVKSDPQKLISPTAKFHHDITFLSDVSNLESLTFPINRLLGELSNFLFARQLHINHFTWHLSHRNHGKKSFSIYLANLENNVRIFLTLTRLKLDQIDDVKEIDNIALSVNRFFPARATPGDLFQSIAHQGGYVHPADKGIQLLNMFRVRLGPDRCFGLSEANDHRPEKAWKLEPSAVLSKEPSAGLSKEPSAGLSKEPSAGLSKEPSAGLSKEPSAVLSKEPSALTPATTPSTIPVDGPDNQPRPAFLLATPKALNETDGEPCLSGKLTILKGPERIDYGWWDQALDKPLTRDYYIARQEDGCLYWVFKYVATGRWFLHGIFS